ELGRGLVWQSWGRLVASTWPPSQTYHGRGYARRLAGEARPGARAGRRIAFRAVPRTEESRLLCRLLLRQTMQRTQSPGKVHGVNADYDATREEIGKDAEREAIAGVVERRDENALVGDVEIRIAGG